MNINATSYGIRSTRLQRPSVAAESRPSESTTFGVSDSAEQIDRFMGTTSGKMAVGGAMGTALFIGIGLLNGNPNTVALGLVGSTVGGAAGLFLSAVFS